MKELLNAENLIEFHNALDQFANYHQNKGGQEAHRLIKRFWDETPLNIRDTSYDYAMKTVLQLLHTKFVP